MSEEIENGNKCLEEAQNILGLSNLDEAKVAFASWMNECFTDLWASVGSKIEGLEDEDYEHFTDQYVCAVGRSSSGGSSGGGEEWVGMLVGFDRRFDMMKRKREMAIDVATADLGTALKTGFIYNGKKVGIGRVFAQDGVWCIEHSKGTYVSKEKTDAKDPKWAIGLDGQITIAMLKPDNTPTIGYGVKSTWAFHGNTKEAFMVEGPRLIILEGAWEAATENWNLWQPITLRGKLDEEGYNGAGPTLTVSNPNAVYGLEWLPEGQKRQTAERLFNPEQYLITTGDSVVNLKDIDEYHLENRRESYVDRKGNQRYDGPLVCVVGGVMDINHEGRESQWDDTGRDYYLSVSNQLLRRENPNARVGVKVSGALHEDFNPLNMLRNGDWVKYARGSRVWVVGRTDSYTNTDGDMVVNIQALGIYAVPMKSIPYQTPSEESNNLGNLNGFGVGE